ncbi:PREDICTED: fasciclin-1 isoform X2 [Nicrophorus vespilloides]|uniref:Fasciclin-1 isoform X2 n=1 Tax=Nicrophorus vespilloides TaxID=110193 RepID=A0ABM1MNW2_NICVS|nr:PREDICTED: fasciclin-1 isoform X2 [Nicrophorus vespilloides]
MSNLARTTDQLGLMSSSSLTSELDGNPPLWVTHKTGDIHDDIYINNARLLITHSNFRAKNLKGYDQVLHKIDEVLVPVMSPKSVSNPIYNPTAWDFIEQFESLNINPYRVRSFRQRVQQTKKEDIFNAEGGNTFFIPVDEGFKNSRPESIDAKVIDGHVIPKHVLFTAPTTKDISYDTLANVDNMKVYISFSEETHGKSSAIYVKSHNRLADSAHTKGVVMAEIVKANIPVKNGVVHLIHKPLMVVDNTVKQFLEEKEDGPLSKFCQEIADAGDVGKEFMRTIERSHDLTLFAPSNAAWDDGNLKSLLRDPVKMREILNMHLVVDKRLYLENIIKDHNRHVYQAPTLNKKKNLYFNVAFAGNNKTLTVEGGGVNATVIQSDLAATNGIIHIIDRVLGVPYSTVLDKLRTDPLLNQTYILGKRSGFNQQLNDTTRKFTYFVPRDKAWKDASIDLPSAIKKLFMEDFTYHANQILERHLVISDIPYTMERIKQLTNDTNLSYPHKEVELPTQRDSLSLFVKENRDHSFVIYWKGEEIPVFRPNVECTNGVIHVIDRPFLKDGDIRVSKASNLQFAPHLIMLLIAKFLLL